MSKKNSYILILYVFVFVKFAQAQQPAYTYYTIRDGLASNDTYNCVEDNKGFLWIATENGVSRFDGKNFKNYTTTQGLPDNDVLAVEMDSDGKIWVLPFQKSPAYYDEKKDRFINSNSDPELKKIVMGNITNSNVLTHGGVVFCNSDGTFYIYKNNFCKKFQLNSLSTKNYLTRIISLAANKFLTVSTDSLRVFENDKLIKKIYFGRYAKRTATVNNQLYVADSATLYKISILPDGSIGNVKNIILPFKMVGLNFTGKRLAISSGTGHIYFADTAKLEFSPQGLSFNALIRYVYEDRAGNTWICSRETGLVRYQQKGILTVSENEYKKNFNSLCFWKNKLVAGTNEGQVLVYNGLYDVKTITINNQKNYASWIRQLSTDGKNLLIAEEGGFFSINKNYQQKTLFKKSENVANKGFLFLNDSSIIAGSSGYVRKLNYRILKSTDSVKIRVTALEAMNANNIYVGANAGLYKWENYKKFIKINDETNLLSNRITSIAYNKLDDILFAGLALDSLVVLKSDKIIAIIPLGKKLPGNECRALYTSKKGELWVGTNQALGKVNYSFKQQNFDYKISFFTTADGIAGKQINDIADHNDTIYVATNAGVSIVPANVHFDVPNIPVYINNISINNKDTIFLNEYKLVYTQNNIGIQFNAADLGSSTELLYEYRINKEDWQSINVENISLLQLAPGDYTVQIRAMNRDGNPSNKIAEVRFLIKNIFWKTAWFWLLTTVLLLAFLFYFTQNRNRKKREQSVQKLLTEKKLADLELKALKAQINPHFVFNCLNSIKFLNHQKSFAETDLYLDKFSYLLRKTLDFSGLQKISLAEELAYSKNYLELEKLRLGDKLQYEIVTDEKIDVVNTLVPPMLFQPYLENAIKHGIRYLPNETGKVTIEILLENEVIICNIKDNGIGIKNASELNKINNPNHKSYGTNLQQRRADLYNVQVKTLVGENGIGTTVKINL